MHTFWMMKYYMILVILIFKNLHTIHYYWQSSNEVFFWWGGRGGGYINWYLMKEDQRKKFKGHLHIIVKCLSHSYNSLFCFSCSTETIQGPGGPPSDCVGGTKHQSTLWAPSQQPPSHHLVPSEWFQCHLREIWWVEWNPSSLWLRNEDIWSWVLCSLLSVPGRHFLLLIYH